MSVRRKPRACYNLCSFSHSSNGFAMPDAEEKLLGPNPPKLFLWLEAAGGREAEQSMPLCGPTGIRFFEVLTPPDLTRADVLIDNTLRCNPQNNFYPTGGMREKAEACCRRWDWMLYAFDPEWIGVTFHPSGLRRAPNTTRFLMNDVAKAWEIAKSGQRVLLLMGEKALKILLPNLPEQTMKRRHGNFWKCKILSTPERLEEVNKGRTELTAWARGEEPELEMFNDQGLWTGGR